MEKNKLNQKSYARVNWQTFNLPDLPGLFLTSSLIEFVVDKLWRREVEKIEERETNNITTTK